jgi:ectoine hydroxylase
LNISALAHQFRENGYVGLSGIFQDVAIQSLIKDLDHWLENQGKLGKDDSEYEQRFDVRVDVGLADKFESVADLFSAQSVRDLTEKVLGHSWNTEGPPLIFSTPINGKQGWHQDTSDVDPGIYMINRIIYPRRVQPEQGGLVVVPGSHQKGDIPKGGNHDDIDGQIVLFPEAGTIVLMHSRCWHRVQENRVALPRTQINWRARPASAPPNLGNNPVFRTGRWDFAASK